MSNRLLVGGAILAAFLGGVTFSSLSPFGITRAFNPPADSLAATQPVAQRATSYPTRRVVRAPQPVIERQVVYQEAPRARQRRSWEREVLIVAGSSGAGAAIGAAAGGGKGAGIGAVSGAVAGLIYDLATRDK